MSLINRIKRRLSRTANLASAIDVANSRESQPVAEAPPPVAPPADPSLADASLSGWFKQETGELFEGFPILETDHVLDVGCGDGAFISFCANQGAEVTFADIDAEKIATVKSRLDTSKARGVHGLVTDANPLPLPDAYADKVVAMEVLEHVDHPPEFLQELVRVGKPGALYLISVPDPVGEQVQKHLAPPGYFEKPNHINIFDRETFERLIVEAGLVVEKRSSYGFYWTVFWAFFWTCDQDLLASPRHPLLQSWANTWELMLTMRDGPRIKKALDEAMPKSQAIIARKPLL